MDKSDIYRSPLFFNLLLSSVGIFSKHFLQYGRRSISIKCAPDLKERDRGRIVVDLLVAVTLTLYSVTCRRQHNGNDECTRCCQGCSPLCVRARQQVKKARWQHVNHLPSPLHGLLQLKQMSPNSYVQYNCNH